MVIAKRVKRSAGEPLAPSWSAGILAGRAEVAIATAVAPSARWWSVRLEPLTQEWGGQAYGGAAAIQTASTWARIRFADGESSPLYVSWPTLGGIIELFAQQLDVTALPVVAEVITGAVGPSWGVLIEDEPLTRVGRQDWCGLQLTPDGGLPLLASDVLTFLLPPYARAVQVRQGPATSTAAMAVQLEVGALGPTGIQLHAQSIVGGGRVELGPRAQILELVNNSATDVDISVFVEVAV